MSDNTTILLNIINNIIGYKDLASILSGLIGTVVAVWAFVRTVRINRRLDDEPYFKNVFMQLILRELCKYIQVLAQDSGVSNTAQALEYIKGFLRKYNMKYDKRFKRVIQRIYGSGLKLQALKSCLNDLSFVVSSDLVILSKIGGLDEERRSRTERVVKRYFPNPKDQTIKELRENKKYIKDVKKTNGNISMVTKRLAKQTAEFNRRIETYKLKFGLPADKDS